MISDPILDDLFHSCSLHAFIEQAREQGDWPDSELTRRRAYKLYEDEKRQIDNGK